MVDIANHRFTDVGRRFNDAYDRTNALAIDRARSTAGNALAAGDFGGAASTLYGAGDLEMGARVAGEGRRLKEDDLKTKTAANERAVKYTTEMAGRLSRILDESKDDPKSALDAFDRFFARDLVSLGETPEEVGQVRQQLAADPRGTVLALGAGAAKELGYEVQGSGDEVLVFDKADGKLVGRYRGARTANVPEGGALYEIPGTGGEKAPVSSPTPAVAPAAASRGDAASMMEALIAQESGGDGNAIGPMTRWGQAMGSTQMLMATAEEQARKLGVPWNPSLMRGDSPRALEYQRKLGQAYLQEGLDKYGGDPEKGLMYYHGGPDEDLWGPKTRAYASEVMARAGLAGGGGADALAGGGEGEVPRLLVQRPKEAKPASRPATPQEKAAYGIPDSLPAQVKPDGTLDVITLPKGTADLDKEAAAKEMQIQKARDIIGTVDAALGQIGWGEAGLIGKKMSEVPGTRAYDVSRQIETIKANLGFQELQAMRQASPTGGALGAIAVQELVALQSTVANLDIGQSEQQLEANLKKIRTHYQRWLDTVEGKSPAAGAKSPPKVGEVKGGYRFRGGNPASPQSWERVQ